MLALTLDACTAALALLGVGPTADRAWNRDDTPRGRANRRRSRAPMVVLFVGFVALVGAGCGSSSAPISTPPSTQSSAISTSSASTTFAPSPLSSLASSLGDLPYQLDLTGWLFGTAPAEASALTSLQSSSPALAASIGRLLDASPSVSDEFVAARIDDPNVTLGGNAVGTSGCPAAIVLQEEQVQNVARFAKFPRIVGTPSADRLTLAVGEVVRVRWRTKDAFGPGTGDKSSIGYAFVVGPTAYTFVFSAPTVKIAGLEPTFEAIVSSFKLRPGSPGSPQPTPVAAASCGPHADLELESLVPQTVAGQTLTHESYRGKDLFERLFGATDADVATINAQLSGLGLTIDDVTLVSDGRYVLTDPPYFVNAMRVKGIPADQLEAQLGIPIGKGLVDHPDAGTFTPVSLGGKQVMRGTLAMVDQTSHQRGLPYVYAVGEIRFVVITDSEQWATDALRQLP